MSRPPKFIAPTDQKPPAIAIIGRPNVGKSTLFNRLTGSREALVSDLPGLTRDRRTGDGQVEGNGVVFIDTAGLEEGKAGSIAARMRTQSEAAIESCDLVLFVIDTRAGVTPDDKAFATLVRKSAKPSILVANKCEGRAGAGGFYDAFELGLGDPVAISAEHGEGLSTLESDIAAALGLESKIKRGKGRRKGRAHDDASPEDALSDETVAEASVVESRKSPIRVAIVGRPNAGKSTLINALVGEDRLITGPEPGLTRDAIAVDFAYDGQPFLLFDTAGLRRKPTITEAAEKLATEDTIKSIRFAEVVMLVLDAERFNPLRPVEHQDLAIGQHVTDEGRGLVIAINKWDLVTDKPATLKAVRHAIEESLAQVPGVMVVPVSGLAERHLDTLFQAVLNTHKLWNRRISTGDLNRWLAEAMGRHPPPATRGRRLKIRFITQPSTRPPTYVAFCSNPDGVPKSYSRYLMNSLRQAFDLPAVPLRFHLRKTANPFKD